jgi:WD40 repeat protein
LSGAGHVRLQAAADGSSFLIAQDDFQAYIQDALTGKQTITPGTDLLASGGPFALQMALEENRRPAHVRNLKTGETWGLLDTGSVAWDLSPEGAGLLTTTLATHRAITAWNTRTSEHQIIYAHPDANLYLANFSRDGHRVLFTSEQRGQASHMWAAPFRQLESVPPAEWTDLGEGDSNASIPAPSIPLPSAHPAPSRKCNISMDPGPSEA